MNLREIGTATIDALPLQTYCKLVNAHNVVRGKPHRIEPVRPDGLHVARDRDAAVYICRRGRHRRYKRGVLEAINRLAGL